MNQRRTVSWLLPIVGLAFVASELQRLFDARAATEACLAAAQDGITCAAAPDALFFVVAGAFGLAFVVRLAYLALEYFRSVR
jgi:hypothetical protein